MANRTHLGHTARKRFGQNFLHDEGVIDGIVSAIAPVDGQTLVEIGPGLGALTEPVCEHVSRLHVIEVDRDLAERLRTHPFIGNKLNIFEQDAMHFDFTTLVTSPSAHPLTSEKLRIFGNLPYNISTPLIFHLFQFTDHIEDMYFMLQKEVVERLAASPGGKTYGKLSVMAQFYCEITPVLDVPPSAFKPAPKVESAVVRLSPYKVRPTTVQQPLYLQKVCAAAFNQRRKTIRNSLKDILSSDAIEAAGIDPSARAEVLSLQEFALLANVAFQQK